MNYRNERYGLSLAGHEHSRQLLNIYESGEFTGDISVVYTRRPDPYRSLMMEGESTLIPIILDREENKVCAMGACVIRKVTLNGEIKTAGYLTGMKSLPEYRKRIPNGAAVYKFLQERTRDKVDIYYTTILKDNTGVQRMLEKKRKNMPEYHYIGEYTVFCLGTGAVQKSKEPTEYRGFSLVKSSVKEVEDFFGANSLAFNFSPVGTTWHALEDDDCYALRDTSGRIVAACSLWNRQSCKQYLVTSYRGAYRYLRKLPLRVFGYPNLPRENCTVNHANMTMLTVKDLDCRLARYFIKRIASGATSYDLLTLGLFENHPLITAMDTIKSIKYRSRVYTVRWTDDDPLPDPRPVNLEIGLL